MKHGHKAVFLPDPQLMTKGMGQSWKPIVSPALWTALEFCKEFKPDTTIIGGDFLDFPKLCKMERLNRLKHEGQRLAHDFELGNQILDIIDRRCS